MNKDDSAKKMGLLAFQWRNLSPESVVSRKQYVLLGALFCALKFVVDQGAARLFFHQKLSALYFLNPWGELNLPQDFLAHGVFSVGLLDYPQGLYYLTMVALALPFIWIGLHLTIRRLNDVKIAPYWSLLFFIPFINLFLFLVLSLLPSASANHQPAAGKVWYLALLDQVIPKSKLACGAVAIFLPSVLGVLGLFYIATMVGGYGFGLFLGLPFMVGLLTVLIYSYHEFRTMPDCLLVSGLASLVMGILIIALAFEGVICLLMAAPIAIAMSLLGGVAGFVFQNRQRRYKGDHLMTFLALVLSWPLFAGAESRFADVPPVYAVDSVMEINAPPEVVWHHVVSFSQLPEPKEWLFQTGIAYPIRARIDGKGVGAIRHCIFSTGEFVEPVEVWNEPYQLGFGVKTMPMPMHEWSYKKIHPPHLDQYLQVTHGQFKLQRLPGNKTRLLGTTWYSNKVWPSTYWKTWSDGIIHAVHLRVLNHIKALSEAQV